MSSRFMRYSVFFLVLASINCAPANGPVGLSANRARISAMLTQYNSCAQLEQDLKSHFKDEMRTRLEILKTDYAKGGREGGVPTAAPAADASGAGRVEGVDYSGTNVQEAGVDEADFVKTDGNYIYVINGKKLEILGVPEFGDADYLTNIDIEGNPTEMLQFGDKLAVFSYVPREGGVGGIPVDGRIGIGAPDIYFLPTFMKITVINLDANRQNPQVEKEIYLDGNYLTARKIGSKAFMVTHYEGNIPGLNYWPYPEVSENFNWNNEIAVKTEWEKAIAKARARNEQLIDAARLDDFVPHFYTKQGTKFEPISLSEQDCNNFSAATDALARGFSSIITVNLLDSSLDFEADHVLSNQSIVYASKDNLLLAEPSEASWWFFGNNAVEEATNIHRFRVTSDGNTAYAGSGRIDGTVLNQFSLSEYNGYVRVVSTSGRFNRWFEPWERQTQAENHVFVLSGSEELDVVGRIDGIAKGERIWASRMIGDKGYLVTFKNIDPLFTIDFSNPNEPKLIGELHVPGVSTYIHPIEQSNKHLLLNVGYGGNNEGLDWSTNVSLYDVTQFERPEQKEVLSFAPSASPGDWASASSEANYEHKAITYWAPLSMLAIPVSTYRSDERGAFEYKSQLRLVRVTPDADPELISHGEIDHSEFFNSQKSYNFYNPDIRRSIFMGDFIYAISLKGVTAHRVSDMQRTAKVELRGLEEL